MIISKPKRVRNEEVLSIVRQKPCFACGKEGPSDPHHVRSRGAGGGDTLENLYALCREHHQMIHAVGPAIMLKRFPWMRKS